MEPAGWGKVGEVQPASFLTEAAVPERISDGRRLAISLPPDEETGPSHNGDDEDDHDGSKPMGSKYRAMIQRAAKRTIMMVRAKNAAQTLEKITVRFSPSQATELPRTVQLPLLKQKILAHNRLDAASTSARLFTRIFQTSAELEAIIKDLFWYFIAHEFQVRPPVSSALRRQAGKHGKLEDDFYARIADNYTALFLRLQMQSGTRDSRVLERLPDVLAQLVFLALHDACPMSRYLLTPPVQERLVHCCYSWFVGFVPTQLRLDHWMPELAKHSQRKSAALGDFPALRNRVRRAERLERIRALEAPTATPPEADADADAGPPEASPGSLPQVALKVQTKERAVYTLRNSPLIASFLERHRLDNNATCLGVDLHLTSDGRADHQEALHRKPGPLQRRRAVLDAVAYAELVAKFEAYGRELKANYTDEKAKVNAATREEARKVLAAHQNLAAQYAYIASQEKGIHELSNVLVCHAQVEASRLHPTKPARPPLRRVPAPRKAH
ncbi:hypothetical protein ACHHYP_15164 [Achlya hypogyna]|uniref:Uncharacterized protein n=1 Tax=Achlya hypogyna TaxID=1202772 RepID=A0A1V9YBI9_ACHHY|nr:hypothetical protein ACHHYP_15164 [Achlya hypogyna]